VIVESVALHAVHRINGTKGGKKETARASERKDESRLLEKEYPYGWLCDGITLFSNSYHAVRCLAADPVGNDPSMIDPLHRLFHRFYSIILAGHVH